MEVVGAEFFTVILAEELEADVIDSDAPTYLAENAILLVPSAIALKTML